MRESLFCGVAVQVRDKLGLWGDMLTPWWKSWPEIRAMGRKSMRRRKPNARDLSQIPG
jgi:hypothetical protein